MAAPRVLILRAPGTNCDEETAFAFKQAGASVERVHVNRLIENPALKDRYQVLCVPGGFSYGDDIAAGRILATRLQQHLADLVHAFVHGYIDQDYPRPLVIRKDVIKDKKIIEKHIPIEPNEDYEITYTPFGTHPVQDFFYRKKLWKALLNNEDVEESMMVNSILQQIENEEEVLNDENEDSLKYTMDTSQIPPKINEQIPDIEMIEEATKDIFEQAGQEVMDALNNKDIDSNDNFNESPVISNSNLSNEDKEKEYIADMLKNVDYQGYSFWISEYEPAEGEC